MTIVETRIPSTSARRETKEGKLLPPQWRPLFLGDWARAVFIHYEVPPEVLQPQIPFKLDLREGHAYVSLVAFTMERLRPGFGGHIAEWLLKPISATRFLNVRTYVLNDGEAGIYFMAEFLSNPLCVPLGPPTFGLPYHLGRVNHRHDFVQGRFAGDIATADRSRTLAYEGRTERQMGFRSCQPGSLDAFLMERYTAFTSHRHKRRLFRIWHSPWLQKRIDISVQDVGLLGVTGNWIREARLIAANCSPGLRDVWIGWPERIRCRTFKRRVSVFFEA